jgi:hypothetical protein
LSTSLFLPFSQFHRFIPTLYSHTGRKVSEVFYEDWWFSQLALYYADKAFDIWSLQLNSNLITGPCVKFLPLCYYCWLNMQSLLLLYWFKIHLLVAYPIQVLGIHQRLLQKQHQSWILVDTRGRWSHQGQCYKTIFSAI